MLSLSDLQAVCGQDPATWAVCRSSLYGGRLNGAQVPQHTGVGHGAAMCERFGLRQSAMVSDATPYAGSVIAKWLACLGDRLGCMDMTDER